MALVRRSPGCGNCTGLSSAPLRGCSASPAPCSLGWLHSRMHQGHEAAPAWGHVGDTACVPADEPVLDP